MKLTLNLDRHCIETAAKKAHEALIRDYLKNQCTDIQTAESKINALKYFLENTDFGHLRSTYKTLNGAEQTRVVLNIPDTVSQLTLTLDGRRIYPEMAGK